MTFFKKLDIDNQYFKTDGSKDLFKKIAETKLIFSSGITHSQISRYQQVATLIQHIAPSKSPTVFDFGCGEGSFYNYWNSNYMLPNKKSIEYTGFEANLEYVRSGLENGVNIVQYDANKDDIKDVINGQTADIVLMMQFIEHIAPSSLEYLLHQAKSFLKPGGFLVLSAPDPDYASQLPEHYHDKEYTFSEIQSILEKYEFKVERRSGWLGCGIPNKQKLSKEEKDFHDKLKVVSEGYANSVLAIINPEFAPYYFLIVRHA